MLVKDLNFMPPMVDTTLPEKVSPPVLNASPIDLAKVDAIVAPKEAPAAEYGSKDWINSFRTIRTGVSTPGMYNAKQYERYTDALFGNIPLKDPVYYDNEELFAENQGFFSELLNGTTKMGVSAINSFVSTFNPGYNNTVSNFFQDVVDKSEVLLPNYYTKDERENPYALRNIFTGNWIGDKLFKNLGFMGGAIAGAFAQDALLAAVGGEALLPEAVIIQSGKIANAFEKAFKASTIASKLVAAEKVENFLRPTITKGIEALENWNNYSRGRKMLDATKATWLLANAAHGEASIEALEGVRALKKDLVSSFAQEHGRLPTANEYRGINQVTEESGNIRYGLNFATIFLTDLVQFGTLFKPLRAFTTEQTLLQGLGGASDKFVLNEAGQLVRRELKLPERIVSAATGKLVQANISEMMQEGLQYSFDKATYNFAKKKWNHEIRGTLGDYLNQQADGLRRMVMDTEGRESMLLGFVTGFAAHGIGMVNDKVRGIPSLKQREDEVAAQFNKIDVNSLFNNETFIEQLKRDTENFNGRTTQEIVLAQMEKAVQDNNVFDFKSLQHELFFNAVRTASALDKFDALVEKLQTLKQLPEDQFAKVFGLDKANDATVSAYIDKLVDEAYDTKAIIDQVNETYPNKYSFKDDPERYVALNEIKTTLAFGLSRIKNINSRMNSVVATIINDNPGFTEDMVGNIADIENFSKKMISPINTEIKQLQQTIEQLEALNEPSNRQLLADNKKRLKTLEDYAETLDGQYKELIDKFELFNNQWSPESIYTYKQILKTVIQHESKQRTGIETPITEMQLEDTINALIDLNKLNKALSIAIDDNNKMQTGKGIDKVVDNYITFLKDYNTKFTDAIRNSNYQQLLKDRKTSIENGKKQLEVNLAQLENLNNEIAGLKQKIAELEAKPELTDVEATELQNAKDRLLANEEAVNDIKAKNENIRRVINALEENKESLAEEPPVEVTETGEVVEKEEVPVEEYVEPVETTTKVVPTPEVSVNVDQQAKSQTEGVIKKENPVAVFLRTVIPVSTDPFIIRFQEFLTSFRKTSVPKPDQEKAALNLFLQDNGLQFSIISPIDDFYSSGLDENGNPIPIPIYPSKFKGFELGTATDTREKRGVVLAITDNEGNPIKLSLQDGKYVRDDENGQYIVQNLPTNLGEFTGEGDKTKPERERKLLAEYRRQVIENERPFIPVNVIEVHPGSPNFIKSLTPTDYEITLQDLENPYFEFYFPSVNSNINGHPSKTYILEARIYDEQGNLMMPLGTTFKTFPEMMLGKKPLLEHLMGLLEAYKNAEDKEAIGDMMNEFFKGMFSGATLNGVKVQYNFSPSKTEPGYFKVFDKGELVFSLNDPEKFDLDKFKQATKNLKLNANKKLLGKEFTILNVDSKGQIVEGAVKDYNKFLVSVGKPIVKLELTLGKEAPKRVFQYIRFNIEGQEELADKIVKPVVATTVGVTVEPKAEIPQAVQARIALVDQFGVPQAQVDRMTSDQVIQMYTEKTTTPAEVTSDIEAKKADISPYGVIAADYLFTGGPGVILSTDYFIQALSGAFINAGSQIEQIRQKYINQGIDLGNLKDAIGTENYNKIISEIRDVINNTYGNTKEIQDIFEVVLKNATGFPTKLGNEISAKLEKLNAELAALEGVKPTEEEVKFESTEDLFKAFQSPANVDTNETLTKEAGDEVQGIKPPEDVTLKVNTTKPKRKLESSKLLTKIIAPEVTQTDIENVQRMFKGNVNIERLSEIVNSDAWATWSASAITLYRGSNRSDLYHEAWHHFSQLYLTRDEKTRLYNETRNKVVELEGKSDLEVEEYIARDFSKFIDTGKISGRYPERKSIFEKILNFLKQLFSGEKDLSLESLYENLRKGEINHKAYSTENIMFGSLNSGINDNFSERESKIIEDGFNGEIVRILNSVDLNQNESSKIEGGKDILYKALYKDLYERYQNTTNPTIKENLGRILVNFDDIKRFHENNSSLFKKEDSENEIDEDNEIIDLKEDGDVEGDEDVENTGKNASEYQESSTMTFGLIDTDGTITSLISNLQEKELVDGKITDVVDPEFGLNKLVDSQKIINLLRERLNGITNFDSGRVNMVDKLKDLSKANPSLLQLIDQLTLRDDADIHQLQAKFVTVFGLTKAPILVSSAEVTVAKGRKLRVIFKDGVIVSNQRRAVENAILNNFYVAKSPIIIRDENGENVINNDEKTIEAIEGMPIVNVKDVIDFYKALGFDVSFSSKMSDAQKKKIFNESDAGYLKQQVILYLTNTGEIRDIVDALKTSFVRPNGVRSSGTPQLLKLINANLEFNENYVSNSFFNSDGKLENEVVMWSTLQKFFDKLNNFQKYPNLQDIIDEEHYANLQGFLDGSSLDLSNSVILNRYFNRDGSRKENVKKIEIFNYNGLQNREEGKLKGKKSRKLFIGDKVLMDMHYSLNENIYPTMQLADKSSFFAMDIGEEFIKNGNTFGNNDFLKIMYGYLEDEINLIKTSDKLNNLKKLSKNVNEGNRFGVFRDILSPGLAEDLIKNGLTEKNKLAVKNEIVDYFKGQLKITLDYMNSLSGNNLLTDYINIDKGDPKNAKDAEYQTSKYIMNFFITSVETSKLIFGNTLMHKDPFKRISGASSTGRAFLNSTEFLRKYQEATDYTQRDAFIKTLPFAPTFSTSRGELSDEVRFITFKDRVSPANYYIENYTRAIDVLLSKATTPQQIEELTARKNAIIKAYSENNGSDAMGACTIDFFRKSLWLAGRWNDKLEKAYYKVVNWDYYNRMSKKEGLSTEERNKYLALVKQNMLTEDEMVYFTVQKFQYYGNIKNENIQEKGFHKFQLMPIIPQMVEGKLWEKHLERMMIEDVDYALFESADKLEKEDANDFYNENDSVDTYQQVGYTPTNATYSYNVKTGYLEGLKEQVFMDTEIHEDLLFGSQIRKLIFNDFNEGVSKRNGEQESRFTKILKTLVDDERQRTFKEASIVKVGDNYKIEDKQKFIKFLEREVDKKVVNKNVKEYLKLTPTGEFAFDLDTNLQRQTIESIINSVLNKRLVKQRMNGEAMVQVSSVGFETYNKDGGTDKLRFYDLVGEKVRKMEVKIPLTGDFRNLLNLTHSDGNRIATRERLNEEIRKGNIDSKAITMIGYRIPTQEHNSIEVMQVQEFLDPIGGSMIVVPYELTAKAGSDFDIDKLNVFKPGIDRDGNYISKISDEELKKAEAEYRDLLDTLAEMETSIDELKSKKDLSVEELNNLSDSYTELDNFIRLLQKPDNELNEQDRAFKDSLYIDEKDRKAILRRYKDQIKDVTIRQKFLSQNLKNDRELLSAIYAQKALIDNYKSALQNETIDIIETTLLRPSNFINLITPNSTFMFDDPIANVIKAIYTEGEDYTIENGKVKLADVKLTKMFLPTVNWQKFNTLYQGKDSLGIAATANVFSQLLQRANVDFTQSYKEQFNLLFKVGKLSSNRLSDGQSKATAFSQMINLYVDIANDPRAGYVNMGSKVTPIINLMVNMGTPVDQIIYFINQPIIRDYIRMKDVNGSIVQGKIVNVDNNYPDKNLFNYLLFGPDSKYVIDGDPKRFKMWGTLKTESVVAPTALLIEEIGDVAYDVTSTEYLKSKVGSDPKDNSFEENKIQLLLLAQYMQLEKMSGKFFEMQRTLNFDTTLSKDGFSSYDREENFKQIQEENVFTNLDVIKNESVISGFNVSDDVVGVNKELLPLMNNEAMYSFIKNILDTTYKFKPGIVKERFVRTFKNDFVSYIFQRYAEKSKSAREYFKSIYGTEDINGYGRQQLETLYKDFLKLKEENPKLFEKYSLLNNMFVSTPTQRDIQGRPDYKNIGLVYFNNDARVQNSYIEQFKELLNNESDEVRKFMNNFAILSFYQSGLNKSRISSTDILPVSIIGKLLKMAKDQYDLEVNTDAKRLEVLKDFYKEYQENNNWDPSQNKAKVEYYVTKDYSIKKAKVPLSQMNKGKKYINDTDLADFNTYLEKSKDALPNEFFTNSSKFREFAAEGRSKPIPQTSIWQLNENLLYDLIDKQSGEVYIENVNLRDGHQYTIKEQFKPKVEAPVEAKPIILEREYTPENITSLKPNEVFVFGSNTEGRHGAGAAKLAKDKFGAIYGQAEGLQGQSYGIVTKNLKEGKRSKNLDPKGEYNALDYIDKQIGELISYATKNPNKKFYVTKLGTMLAGWTTEEIGEIWNSQGIIPNNIILPKEFENYINPENREAKPTAAPIQPSNEEIFQLQEKLNKILFKNAIDSKLYEIYLGDEIDKSRALKLDDFEKVKNKELQLYDESGEISLKDLLENEFNKITKVGLTSYIDVYDLKSLLEEFYDTKITVSDFKSDILIQKQNLEKVLPELSKYQRDVQLSLKEKQDIYNNSKLDMIYDLSRYEGSGGAVAGFTLNYEGKSLGYAMIDPNYSIRYITIYPEYEGFGLATKFINEIRKAAPDKEMSISLINNPKMFKIGEKLGGVKISDTKIKLPALTTISQPTAAPIEIEPGRYVKYNGETFIVTKLNQNKTWQIYNPLLEGVNAKRSVSKDNLEPLDTKARIVNYQGTDYIVTPKETIISLQTNKIQKWLENDGKRLAILALAKEGPKEETKIGEAVPEGYTAIEDMFGETQRTDEEILNSPEFNDYMISELKRDPSLTEEQILETYKKCKG